MAWASAKSRLGAQWRIRGMLRCGAQRGLHGHGQIHQRFRRILRHWYWTIYLGDRDAPPGNDHGILRGTSGREEDNSGNEGVSGLDILARVNGGQRTNWAHRWQPAVWGVRNAHGLCRSESRICIWRALVSVVHLRCCRRGSIMVCWSCPSDVRIRMTRLPRETCLDYHVVQAPGQRMPAPTAGQTTGPTTVRTSSGR